MTQITFTDLMASVLVLTGAAILAASLAAAREVYREAREFSGAWRSLFVLIVTFIIGYFTYELLIFGRNISTVEFIVSVIFFMGSCFVYVVSRISMATIREMKRIMALERHRASHDDLTGLPNRCFFAQRIDETIADLSQDGGKHFAVMLMDLDRFKVINDTLGHYYGDILLQEVASRLRGVITESHTLARLGGDEFAVLVDRVSGPRRLMLISERIQQVLNKPFIIEGHPADVGLSIGVATFPEHGATSDLLMKRAEIAMYAAKKLPNHAAVYGRELDRHSVNHLSILGELRHAIDNDNLQLHFQPQVDVKTRRICGVEALVRWPHPRYGMLPPEEFVPLAEQSGLINVLDRWVMECVFQQLSEWDRENIALSISTNLSVKNLQDPDFFQFVIKGVQSHRFPPRRLKLEITESAVMADPEKALDIMTRLHSLGVQFAIDDFGTGYSSLSYLKQLPVNEIKIDKSFVIDMSKDENDTVIVRSTIELAHNMDLQVTAEGVEQQEALDLLIMLGCDAVQGYFISRPMTREVLQNWIVASSYRVESLMQVP